MGKSCFVNNPSDGRHLDVIFASEGSGKFVLSCVHICFTEVLLSVIRNSLEVTKQIMCIVFQTGDIKCQGQKRIFISFSREKIQLWNSLFGETIDRKSLHGSRRWLDSLSERKSTGSPKHKPLLAPNIWEP